MQAAVAMLALRPRWNTADVLVDFIDASLRPNGYRLVGAFDGAPDAAVSVIGFRQLSSTAWGHYLYIDDVSTIAGARGRGHADTLMAWVAAEARRRNCEGLHLDSGVAIDRAVAHRLYMRHRMHISAHHFTLTLNG